MRRIGLLYDLSSILCDVKMRERCLRVISITWAKHTLDNQIPHHVDHGNKKIPMRFNSATAVMPRFDSGCHLQVAFHGNNCNVMNQILSVICWLLKANNRWILKNLKYDRSYVE